MDTAVVRPRLVHGTTLAAVADLSQGGVRSDDRGVTVTGISLSTSRIVEGDLYAALPGTRVHGARYAADAVRACARAILTDEAGAVLAAGTAPLVVVLDVRRVLGAVSAAIYQWPSRGLRMIGVTGTQGKTTTTRLLEASLQTSGVHAAVIGTVGTRIDGAELKTALTTPEAPDLQGLLGAMVESGVEVCAMEVSSHALVMGRVDGVYFDVAAFANLGRDHLDFHADMEDYFEAKAQLLTPGRTRRGLVNVDDAYGRRLVERGAVGLSTYSSQGSAADWRAVDIVEEAAGSTFRVYGPGGVDVLARVNLPGAYNVSNALCALALGAEAGYNVEACVAGMAQVSGVPGRLERISALTEGAPTVYVDYAHKPDAITAALTALRSQVKGALVIVLGAGGDRDEGKRPLMGAAAATLADQVIITDDNPRSEDPATIRAAVLAGAQSVGGARVIQIADRGEAIREAIAAAGRDDVVLIAGKGHEKGQEVAGIVYPFDDAEQARAALKMWRRA